MTNSPVSAGTGGTVDFGVRRTPPQVPRRQAADHEAKAGGLRCVATAVGSGRLGTLLAICWLALVVILVVIADLLPLPSYEAINGELSQPPGVRWPEFLGTDNLGRSLLARVVYGARPSVIIALGATTLGVVIGGIIGTVSGYLRGATDALGMLVVDALLSVPPIVLLLAVTASMRPSIVTLSVALGVISIPLCARLARAHTLAIAQTDYVLAARATGASGLRIILREVAPNVAPHLASFGVIVAAHVIVAEGALSFIGLGTPPPHPSWGGMIAGGRPRLAASPHITFVPALALFATVLSMNVVGERLRRGSATA